MKNVSGNVPVPGRAGIRGRFASVARYLLTGGFLFIVDYSVFFVLHVILSADISLSQAISRTFGASAGFLLHKVFVFRDPGRNAYRVGAQGLGYILLVVWNVFFSSLLIRFAARAVPAAPLPALKIAVEIVMVCETYLVLTLIFRRHADDR